MHWDNELSKAVPFMEFSMSPYDGFYGSAVVPWAVDKLCIVYHLVTIR